MIAQDPIALQSFGTAREDSERKSSAAPSFLSANEERPLDLQDERDQAPPDGGRQAWTTVACCSVITYVISVSLCRCRTHFNQLSVRWHLLLVGCYTNKPRRIQNLVHRNSVVHRCYRYRQRVHLCFT